MASALSQVGLTSYAHPWSRPLVFPGVPRGHNPRSAVCLLWGAALRLLPSWQISTIQDPRKTLLATGSLLTVWWKMQSLGEDCSSPLPSGSGCHTAASPALGREGPKQQLACSPCSLGHNPLFCEHARGHHMALEPFVGKVLFFFLSHWQSQGLGCYVSLTASDCPQGIQVWSLP